jgi:lysophospholipase L1-like esterase
MLQKMKVISARYHLWLLIVLIVSFSFGFTACEKEDIVIADPPFLEASPDTSTTSTTAVRYLALGDSYTIGESVPESQRFPVQLADKLRQDSFTVQEVKIIARTGWTTNELSSAILQADLPDTLYNFVSLLIGVNNQYRGRSLENYQEEFTALLFRAIELAGDQPERVIVLSIPDYGVTPFVSSEEQARRIAAEIDAFNDAAAHICLAQQVRFLNITPISRLAADDDTLIASDGLHPSGKMYGLWVNEMLPIVKNMLK